MPIPRLTLSPSRRLTYEVERKFTPTPTSIHLLRTNTGHPPFAHISPLPTSRFHDTYYDTPTNTLSCAGIWLRRRDAIWQAKVRRGGDFANSRFLELEGEEEVGGLLQEVVPWAKLTSEGLKGLEILARFGTVRRRWCVDGRIGVVVDEASFGHVVGEVELVEEIGVSGEEEDEVGEEVVARLDGEIRAFMEKYAYALPTGSVEGKLSAYFKHGGFGSKA